MPYKDPEARRLNARLRAKQLRQEHPEKRKAYLQKYRIENAESVREREKAYRARTPEKQLEYKKRWEAKNPDKVRAQRMRTRIKHTEKLREYHKKYYQEHAEEMKEWMRQYRQKYPDRVRLTTKKYLETHKEALKEKHRLWVKNNPEKHAAGGRRHRAAKANAPINDLSAAQWREIKAVFKNCCAYCGRKMQRLTQDHITPLSKRGPNTASNVIPACQSCNSRKGTGTVLKPIQPLFLTVSEPQKPRKKTG